MPPWFAAQQKSERRVALTVATAFAAGGIAWILVTDVLLYTFARDAALIGRIETAKGWTFVLLSALLLYGVTLRGASRLTRAQAAMSAVVDSIADGVLLLGPYRTIVYANPAAVRMLGCQHREELVGMGAPEFSRRFRVSRPDGSLVPPDRFISQRVFDEGGPLHYKAVLHPPGVPAVIISATAAAVRSSIGARPDMVVSVMHDITAADRLESLRDQFLAAAAHSFKTPVAVIKAHVQVLSRSEATEVRRSIGPIRRQCDRIDRLIQNLLVLARLRSRTLRLHPTRVKLGPLVEGIVEEMAGTSRDHSVRAELLAAPRAHVDEERLALTLRNVIDSAFRTSVAGSAVTVLLRRAGVDAEIGVRYRPLPQEETVRDRYGEYDDLGINRCVATAVVEAHGGTLRRDAAGVETTEWIRLPAMDEPHGYRQRRPRSG